MKTLLNHCHHDVPSEASDCGEIMKQRASEACGFDVGQDAFASHDQMMRRGGPEAIVDRAAKRAEKAGQR
jgi:hypothetical protein